MRLAELFILHLLSSVLHPPSYISKQKNIAENLRYFKLLLEQIEYHLFRARSDGAVDQLAVLKHEQSGNTHNIEL